MTVPAVALLTDFGHTDSYVGEMHLVLADVPSTVRLIDICHEIQPQNILQAALVLNDILLVSPAQTVHVIVVDPGVGSTRRAIAAEIGHWKFVAPDNGVLSVVLENWAVQAAVELAPERWMQGRRSTTFHGRDLFAPVARELAQGRPLTELGVPISEPLCRLEIPQAVVLPATVIGEVLWSDHYGNLVTNIRQQQLTNPVATVQIGKHHLPLVTHYAAAEIGQLVAVIGSHHRLEISVRQGSAAEVLGMGRGQRVQVKTRV